MNFTQEQKPLVSVIIPTFNRSQLIGRTINSVLDQTFRNFELIIVDDGSTDNTEEVVKSFLDARIIYLKHDINKGAPAARNTAIRIAKGQYIGFLDSDDEWLPKKLEKQLGEFQSSDNKVGAVFAEVLIYPSKRRTVINVAEDRLKLFNHLVLFGNVLPSSTALLKKTSFDKIGLYDEQLPACQDFDLWLKLLGHYSVKIIHEPLAIMHCSGEDRISKNIKAREKAFLIVYDRISKDLTMLQKRKCWAVNIANVGYLYYIGGEILKGRERALSALRFFPFSRRVWVYLISVYIPQNLLRKIRKLFLKYNPLE